MATNNSKSATAQVNGVNNTNNAGIDPQVMDNKSALAGEQEKVYKTLISNLHKLYKSRSTINGRLLDLAECAGEYASIVKSNDFKGAVKSHLDHLTLVQTDGKGNAVGTYCIPVKWAALSSRESYTDYKIEDLVVKYMGRKSAKNWSLISYTHDGNDTIVSDFAQLRHEYTTEVTRMVEAFDKDGKSLGKIADRDDDDKIIKDTFTDIFVPVVCDTVKPKVFESAVEKAVAAMWLILFAK